MRSSQCESGSSHNTSGSPRDQHHSAMSPVHSSSLMLALLFISLIPVTSSAPVLLNPSSTEEDQLLTQITTLCSFYLSADPSFRTSEAMEDLCILMLGSLQKSKESTARETSKRSTVLHPLLELIPQLNRRRSRRMKLNILSDSRRRTFKSKGGSRTEGTSFIGHEMEEDLLSMCKTTKNSVPSDPILQMCDPEQDNLNVTSCKSLRPPSVRIVMLNVQSKSK